MLFDDPPDSKVTLAGALDMDASLVDGFLKISIDTPSVTRYETFGGVKTAVVYPGALDMQMIISDQGLTVQPIQLLELMETFQKVFPETLPQEDPYFRGLLEGKTAEEMCPSSALGFFDAFEKCVDVDTKLDKDFQMSTKQRAQHMVRCAVLLFSNAPRERRDRGFLVVGSSTMHRILNS